MATETNGSEVRFTCLKEASGTEPALDGARSVSNRVAVARAVQVKTSPQQFKRL